MAGEMTKFVVNGRDRYFAHLRDFRSVAKGKYTVVRNTTTYRIEGGRHLGGNRWDWFVECDEWAKPIICSSVMDSLRLLDRM